MTHDKAREFFSAYHEGTLEPGLRASLERSLSADAELRAEYAAFADTVASLDALRHEPIEIPAYLGDRIAGRLDPVLSAKRIPFWKALFAPPSAPRYGWAVAAGGAFLVAAVGLRGFQASGTTNADVLSMGGEAVRWSTGGEGVVGSFAGSGARTVGVVPDGGEAREYHLAASQPLELTLSNPNAAAKRFRVTVGDEPATVVAVPGKRPIVRHAGSGTVTELASALADAYRVAVVVKGIPAGTSVRWNFASVDARAAAEESLDGHGNATMMDGNVLQIGQ